MPDTHSPLSLFPNLLTIAKEYGWVFECQHHNQHFMRFSKGEKRMDIWPSGTVRLMPRRWANNTFEWVRDEESLVTLFKKYGK